MVRKTLVQISLLLALAIAPFACSDDPSPTTQERLIGTWTITTADIETSVGTQSLHDYLVNVLDFTSMDADILTAIIENSLIDELDGSITFKSDNTYTSVFGGDSDSGTWELSADGGTLTLKKGTPDEVALTISSITSSTLIVVLQQLTTEDLDDDTGTPETSILAKATITLTK